MARSAERTIGIYPEIKTPEFYKQEIPDFDFSLELANALTKDPRFEIHSDNYSIPSQLKRWSKSKS